MLLWLCVFVIPPFGNKRKGEDSVELTHWGRVTHICVSNLTIIGPDNGFSPGRRQAIIRTNAGILLIEPLRTNFSEILFWIQTFSFKKLHLKMSSAKWRPFCLGLNVLTHWGLMMPYHRIHHGSWSALVQAVACHWLTLSHYQNQCSVAIRQTLRNTFQWNFIWNSNILRSCSLTEIYPLKWSME